MIKFDGQVPLQPEDLQTIEYTDRPFDQGMVLRRTRGGKSTHYIIQRRKMLVQIEKVVEDSLHSSYLRRYNNSPNAHASAYAFALKRMEEGFERLTAKTAQQFLLEQKKTLTGQTIATTLISAGKWYSIFCRGNLIKSAWGSEKTYGNTSVQYYRTATVARNAYDLAVAARKRRGYKIVDEDLILQRRSCSEPIGEQIMSAQLVGTVANQNRVKLVEKLRDRLKSHKLELAAVEEFNAGQLARYSKQFTKYWRTADDDDAPVIPAQFRDDITDEIERLILLWEDSDDESVEVDSTTMTRLFKVSEPQLTKYRWRYCETSQSESDDDDEWDDDEEDEDDD